MKGFIKFKEYLYLEIMEHRHLIYLHSFLFFFFLEIIIMRDRVELSILSMLVELLIAPIIIFFFVM